MKKIESSWWLWKLQKAEAERQVDTETIEGKEEDEAGIKK